MFIKIEVLGNIRTEQGGVVIINTDHISRIQKDRIFLGVPNSMYNDAHYCISEDTYNKLCDVLSYDLDKVHEAYIRTKLERTKPTIWQKFKNFARGCVQKRKSIKT